MHAKRGQNTHYPLGARLDIVVLVGDSGVKHEEIPHVVTHDQEVHLCHNLPKNTANTSEMNMYVSAALQDMTLQSKDCKHSSYILLPVAGTTCFYLFRQSVVLK